jgi:hypothetical protein
MATSNTNWVNNWVDQRLKGSDSPRVGNTLPGTAGNPSTLSAGPGQVKSDKDALQEVLEHPLAVPLLSAIEQAMYGKGERHGGAKTPFMKQPWVHYHAMHGRGFLTGQAAKKLEEAASTRSGEAFRSEILGAIVYLGMALICEESKPE